MAIERVVEPISKEIEAKISARFKEAVAHLKSGDKDLAAQAALDGWQLMPEPRFGWDVSLSKVRVLVHILKETGNYSTAIEVLQQQLQSKFYRDYQYHPHFLLGTVYFAMGQLDLARESLKIADKISTGRCFVDENPQYKKLARS